MGKKLLSATGHKLDFQGQLIDRNQDLFLHGNFRYFGGTGDNRTMVAKTGYLLEGAPNYEDYLTDGTITNKGAIFVFNDSGTFLGKIQSPAPATNNNFSYSMRFRLDGNRLIVSEINADPLSGTNQGIAYLYDTSDSNWENWTLLNAYQMPNYYSSTAGDELFSVAVSDDYVICGHRSEDSSTYTNMGVVHVFNANAPYQYLRTITNPNPENYDNFGHDVDIYGSTAVIGVPFDDRNTSNAGTAYLYNVSTGGLISEIYNYEHSSYRQNGYYGRCVAINADRVVVSAYRQGDYAYPSGQTNVGYLYVYTHTGVYQRQITPTNNSSSYVGYSFDLSAGGVIVIGNGTSAGSVYAYTTSGTFLASRGNPNINTKSASDSFGRRVAIERESTSTSNFKWYANAPNEDDVNAENKGKIYRYTGSAYNGYIDPPEDGILLSDSREENSGLGYSVTLNERYAAAGAYQAYDWEDDSSNSMQAYSGIVNVYDARNNFQKIRTIRNFNIYSTKGSDNFGRSVELQRDGDLLAISATSEDSALYSNLGVVYVYDIATDTLQRAIQNPNPDTSNSSDYFGQGASSDGAVAIDDTYIAIGAGIEEYDGNTNAGRVYIYNHINGVNTLNLNSPNPTGSGYFGRALDMRGDIIAVGAYREGALTGEGIVYIFNKLTGSLLSTINNPNASTYDYFGSMVKISPNGIYMAVAAYNEDFNSSGSGSVYLYDISNPSSPLELWRQDGLQSSELNSSNIALSDYHVVSGAYTYDGVTVDTGRTFVYDIDGNLLQTLYPTNPYSLTVDTVTNFGFSVGVNNNSNVVVGEPYARKTAIEDDYGAVYFYR